MEGMMSSMSQKGTTLHDDASHRLKERPLSQPQPSKLAHLVQAPGRGQGFADFGSSFGTKKPRTPTVDSDPEDEMDLFSSAHGSVDAKRVYKAKSTSKGKGKAKADDEREGVVINGKLLPYHEDFKPKKMPSFTKTTRTTSADDAHSSPKSKSSSRPKPKAAYLGSSSNPIPIAVEQKSKSKHKPKPLSTSSSRTGPLHDRSPNRPSQATTSRPIPRPANRGTKKSNPDPFLELSPLATDLDSPAKVKGNRKTREFPMDDISPVADRRVEKSSSFPEISPLAASRTRVKTLQEFPDLSPLSSPVKAKGAGSDDDDSNDNDELRMDSDDDILTRGGPRPFPMSTQMLESIPRAGKRLSAGSGDRETRESKKRRDDDVDGDVFMTSLDYADISEPDDSLFLDPSIDPSTLCPYCDEPLPPTPTPHLLALLASTLRRSYTDPRPANPKGLKAPLGTFIAVCQRHRFESVKLPEAQRKKWPMVISFEDVRGRVEKMKGRLEAIILDGDKSGWDSSSDEEGTDDRQKERGPRGKSVFWRDIIKEVKKKGSRAVVGVSGQFANFEKTQPGYYGELGSVIIHQTLYSLFPPSSFDPTLITPLTPTEFIQRILVPEAAVGLIMEDRQLDSNNDRHKQKAVKILRESAAYGVAMFPDADTNSGGKGKGKEEDWDMGVGDEIVRERARARRKELEEEERMEEEMWVKNESERLKRDAGGKKHKKDETKSKGKRKEKESQVVEISETSDAGRPRPHPRKVQRDKSSAETDEVPLTSDGSNRTNGRRTTSRKKNHASSKKAGGDAVDIDLCSSTSEDTTRRDSRKQNKGKGKGKERETSVESLNLMYPPSDAMLVDGSDKNGKMKAKSTRSDSEELQLLYPSSPPKTKPLMPNSSIVSLLSEDDETTPRPQKAPLKVGGGKAKAPVSNASSVASYNAKTSFPLQIARDRRPQACKAAEESEWKRHLSPQLSGIDDDGNASDDSIRSYLMRPARARQKNKDSWLLSQSSSTSTEST